ncbi:uncharacterized protein PV09_04435 [Verruconis gallopava]|uniref:Uncharacterized protein n=1 Tax=Verruconis gallopava TaxID=253628 RepID=A0A0D1XQ43_9PEZI|nr:uncharacterized protein PV09_04435 [Verruconis gallopava]KIW04701.1 hypothetical protein PV09_04435 [Verruconis gallopava]
MDSSNTFQFGKSAKFEFNMPGKFESAFPIPAQAPETKQQPSQPPLAVTANYPGNQYVTLAQYEDLEKRLEALTTEVEKEKCLRDMVRKSATNMEQAYQGLQNTHQAAVDRIKELEIALQDSNKRLEICKAALENSQAQYKATAKDLQACQAKLEAAEASVDAKVHEFKVKLENELVEEHFQNLMMDLDKEVSIASPSTTPPPLSSQPTNLALATPITVAETVPTADKRYLRLELEKEDVVVKYDQLLRNTATLLRGQRMANWTMIIFLALMSMHVAAWLTSPSPAGPGAFGFGWIAEDSALSRLHAWALTYLVEATGGLRVYL